jgi:hypothetical protein
MRRSKGILACAVVAFTATLSLSSLGVQAATDQATEIVKSQKASFKAAYDQYSMLDVKDRAVANVDVDATKCKINSQRSMKVGKVVFKPLTEEPFVMFVMDDRGDTYTVNVEPVKGLSPDLFTIVNKAAEAKKQKVLSAQNRYEESTVKSLSLSDDRERMVTELVKAMATDSRPGNADVEVLNMAVPLWQESRLTQIRNYTTGVYTGKAYVLKNVSGEQMKLAEQEFYTLNKNTLAVAIENPVLEHGESTLLYIVTANQ